MSVGKCIGDDEQSPSSDCKLRCTRDYVPVCGENSNAVKTTFATECVMRLNNCETNTG